MKHIQQEAGFTLIEMLIVLLIISILILITIPNVTKHFATIDEKGCAAYISIMDLKSNLLNKASNIKGLERFEGITYFKISLLR